MRNKKKAKKVTKEQGEKQVGALNDNIKKDDDDDDSFFIIIMKKVTYF